MEKEKIISGWGSGSGSGWGSGEGWGSGSGPGSGSASGEGWGSGSGSGSGWGSGEGWGSGWGSGSGSGEGWGSGSGSGSGSGEGWGSGWGSGSGSASGEGWGSGSGLILLHGQTVHYIDGIPCLPVSVHGDTMAVDVIDEQDWTLSRAYVARWQGEVAHGGTVRQAVEAARNKYFDRMDPGEKKRQLLDLFAEKRRLTVKELYAWHGHITGSCEFGRSRFQEEHGLKDDDTLSLEEFVELTRDAYGGDLIASLLEE